MERTNYQIQEKSILIKVNPEPRFFEEIDPTRLDNVSANYQGKQKSLRIIPGEAA